MKRPLTGHQTDTPPSRVQTRAGATAAEPGATGLDESQA
jgi:hypothetical protein